MPKIGKRFLVKRKKRRNLRSDRINGYDIHDGYNGNDIIINYDFSK
jgi:hypothetical protein